MSELIVRTPTTAITNAKTDTSIVITRDATSQNGDVLYLFLGMGFTQTALTSLDGWTQIGRAAVFNSNILLQTFYKTAFNEPSSYTIALPGTGNTALVLIPFANTDVSMMVTNANIDNSTVHATPSITTSVASLLLHVYAMNASASLTPDAATTKLVEIDKSATFPVQIMIARESQTTGGVTNGRTVTTAGTVSSIDRVIGIPLNLPSGHHVNGQLGIGLGLR